MVFGGFADQMQRPPMQRPDYRQVVLETLLVELKTAWQKTLPELLK